MSVVKLMAAALQDELQSRGLRLPLAEYERIISSVIERVSKIAQRDILIVGSEQDNSHK